MGSKTLRSKMGNARLKKLDQLFGKVTYQEVKFSPEFTKMPTLDLKELQLREGEIISISGGMTQLPRIKVRVEGFMNNLVRVSVGEISMGIVFNGVNIHERNLVEPINWLAEQVKVLENQLRMCDCAECKKSLSQKKAALAGHGVSEVTL